MIASHTRSMTDVITGNNRSDMMFTKVLDLEDHLAQFLYLKVKKTY
jgi:hypothetical protein